MGVFVLAAAGPVSTDFACVLRFWCLVSSVKDALDTFERSCDLIFRIISREGEGLHRGGQGQQHISEPGADVEVLQPVR